MEVDLVVALLAVVVGKVLVEVQVAVAQGQMVSAVFLVETLLDHQQGVMA